MVSFVVVSLFLGFSFSFFLVFLVYTSCILGGVSHLFNDNCLITYQKKTIIFLIMLSNTMPRFINSVSQYFQSSTCEGQRIETKKVEFSVYHSTSNTKKHQCAIFPMSVITLSYFTSIANAYRKLLL